MTPKDILNRVTIEADARFGDTMDLLLALLRRQHRHQSWRKECFCEMCQHIRHEYVNAKLSLHYAKRRIDRWENMDWEPSVLRNLEGDLVKAIRRVNVAKDYQKRLNENVL